MESHRLPTTVLSPILNHIVTRTVRGAPTCKPGIVQNPVAHLPVFSITCAMPILQLFCFDALPFSWGVCTPLHVQAFQCFDVSDLSPLFSLCCALFCTLQKHNSFLFNRFRTLCQKPPGVGVGTAR